jgi:site-specific recombinase XerD
LFRFTLNQPDICIEIPLRKPPERLPELLSREKVESIIAACTNLRHRTLLTTMYATGLRVSELCQLKVSDVDSKRMMLRIGHGKGGKDRYTLLSPKLLETLRIYWHVCHPQVWLFPNKAGDGPITDNQVQRCFYSAKQRANIHKQGGIHSLRHAFATHLLDSGVDLHSISRLMGHNHLSTTARYLHLQQHVVKTDSPLDLLSHLSKL